MEDGSSHEAASLCSAAAHRTDTCPSPGALLQQTYNSTSRRKHAHKLESGLSLLLPQHSLILDMHTGYPATCPNLAPTGMLPSSNP